MGGLASMSRKKSNRHLSKKSSQLLMGSGEDLTENKSNNEGEIECADCGAKKAHAISEYKFKSGKSVALCDGCAKLTEAGEMFIMNKDRSTVDDGEFVLIAPDIYAANAWHGPGNMNIPGMWTPNRMLVFKCTNSKTGERFLCAFNQIRPEKKTAANKKRAEDGLLEPFGALKRLERRTGLKLKYCISVESTHNLYLKEYAEKLPEVKIGFPAGRIFREVPDLIDMDNTFCFENGSPFVKELADCGIQLWVWEGFAENKLHQGNRPKMGTEESTILFHEANEIFVCGSHAMWSSSSKSPPYGFLFKTLLKINKKGFTVIPKEGGQFMVNVHSLVDVQEGVKKITEEWDWKSYLDYHQSTNDCLNENEFADEFAELKKDLTETIFDNEHFEKTYVKKLEIPKYFYSDSDENYKKSWEELMESEKELREKTKASETAIVEQ